MRETMKTKFYIYLLIILLPSALLFNQEDSRGIILKAMKDEMSRNITRLSIENLKKPFFISYNIHDQRVFSIKSSLGAIIQSVESPLRKLDTRVIVGDYKRTQENFFSMEGGDFYNPSGSLPIENDYDGIRRVLWKSTDNAYKKAAESYESKISALKQQKMSPEDSALNDFSAVPKLRKTLPPRTFKFEKDKWEKAAKELSIIFNKYHDIFKSEVLITFLQGDEFILNSEGTEVIFPFSLASVQVNATTQAEDGEPLNDQVLYYQLTPNDLPDIQKMKADVKQMADNIIALRKAKPFTESYSGPVLFEGDAMGEMVSQRFFGGSEDLISIRKQVFGNPQMLMFADQMIGKSIEDKIGKKILPDYISIKATPKRADFNGINLIGAYQIDMEGVEPPDELSIIENGTLKTLLNDRTPIPKVESSNGHKRINLGGSSIESTIAPGVIELTSSKTIPSGDIKKKLIEIAKENNLEYAIIVRKLKSNSSGISTGLDEASLGSMNMRGSKKGTLSKPISLYKVYVDDGREELVRNVELGAISMPALKKIKVVSDKNIAFNTLLTKSGGSGSMFSFVFSFLDGDEEWNLNGVPSSFIIPDGMIVDELEVQKAERIITTKLPIVENPVGD